MKKIFDTSNLPSEHNYHDDMQTPPINFGIVLTGGGSHGAFEAGVLETILPHLHKIGKISLITGTSAGAVNAVAVGGGLNASGPKEAIARLRATWNKVKAHGNIFSRGLRFFSDSFLPAEQRWPNLPESPFQTTELFQSLMPSTAAQFISKTVSQITPDWKSEVQNGPVRIAINTSLECPNAPNTFEHVVLTGEDLTPDGVGASANIKKLGVHYICDTQNPDHQMRRAYDGAYHENGLLNPDLDPSITDYVMIVLHDRRHGKLDEEGALKHAEIHTHAMAFATYDSHSPIRLHAVEIKSLGGEIGGLAHMNDTSKFNTDQEFIDLLYASGVEAGQKWIEENMSYLGEESSYTLYPPALRKLEDLSFH